MSRPHTKDDLLISADNGFRKLQNLLNDFSLDLLEAEFGFEDRDRNVRDVLIHVHEWHNLLLKWVAANTSGDPQPFLPSPYNWRNYKDLNDEFLAQHRGTSVSQARELVEQSHVAVISMMSGFTDEELFTKGFFDWTGTTTLGSYCVSATSSHYDWAVKKLRMQLKAQSGA